MLPPRRSLALGSGPADEEETAGTTRTRFSDVAPIISLQQRAQNIARTAGVEVGPDFGAGMGERLAADFGKGLATSMPGRLIGRAMGATDTVEELARLPASQPIPYFPDLDTAGNLVGDAAMFSLVPPLAAPGRIIGGALGARAAARLSRLPILANRLAKGSMAHQGLATSLAERMTTFGREAGAAAGSALTAGGGEYALARAAGYEPEVAAISGVTGGVAAAFAPAFRALSAGAQVARMTDDRFLQAERALAESLDTSMGALAAIKAVSGIDTSGAAWDQARTSFLDELAPGFANEVLAIEKQVARKGGFAKNLPEVRELVKSWEEISAATMRGRLENFVERGGWHAAYNAHTKLFRSIDTSLRRLGGDGVRLANGLSAGLRRSDRVYAELANKVAKAVDEVPDDAFANFVRDRERGMYQPGASPALDAVAKLLDEDVPQLLAGRGLPIDGLDPGRHFPHVWDSRKLEQWLWKPGNVKRLAALTGTNEDDMFAQVNDILRSAAKLREQPITQVMRANLDLSRKLNITIDQAKALGMPIGDPKAALARYLRQVGDRVGYADAFGPNGERLDALLEGIKAPGRGFQSPISANLVEKSVRKVIGLDGEVGDISGAFSWAQNNVIVPNTLLLASISNVGQNVNTMSKFGVRHFARAAAEVKREARAFAGRGGDPTEFAGTMRKLVEEIGGDVGDLLTGQRGATGLLLPKTAGRESIPSRLNLGAFTLSRTGFNTVDRWNRTVASYAGRSWMEDTVAKAVRGTLSPRNRAEAVREFRKIGLDLEAIAKRGALTKSEMVEGALELANMTQFRIRPVDMPLYWSSPNAAVFRMLKTFAFQQGRFLKKQVFGEAARYARTNGKQGSLRPLAFFLAGYPAAGAMVGTIRSALKGQVPFEDQSPGGAYLSSLAWVGGLGLLHDFGRSLDGGSKAILQFGAGPMVSKAVDFTDALVRAVDNPKVMGRHLLNYVPGVAQNVANSRNYLLDALDLKD